jgi:integrase
VYSQGLRPALRRAGLRYVTLHGLRHGFGSMLASAGVSIGTVQVVMGHANVTLTLQTYTHLLPGDGAAVARTSLEVPRKKPGNTRHCWH